MMKIINYIPSGRAEEALSFGKKSFVSVPFYCRKIWINILCHYFCIICYYKEVLKAKVHPDDLAESPIPKEFTQNLDQLWKDRYSDIVNIEDYLYRNGFPTVKFYLNT